MACVTFSVSSSSFFFFSWSDAVTLSAELENTFQHRCLSFNNRVFGGCGFFSFAGVIFHRCCVFCVGPRQVCIPGTTPFTPLPLTNLTVELLLSLVKSFCGCSAGGGGKWSPLLERPWNPCLICNRSPLVTYLNLYSSHSPEKNLPIVTRFWCARSNGTTLDWGFCVWHK